MKTYIAIKTGKSKYKFINVNEAKETIGNIACVVLMFAVVYLMMFI